MAKMEAPVSRIRFCRSEAKESKEMSDQTKRMGGLKEGGTVEPSDAELELAGLPRPGEGFKLDRGRPLPVTSEPSVALMLQTAIDKGVTADNVSALEKLV